MQTITSTDIKAQVVIPALAGEFDAETVDAVTDAILDAAPVSTWSLDGTEYVSTALSTEDFWATVERVTTGTTATPEAIAAEATSLVDYFNEVREDWMDGDPENTDGVKWEDCGESLVAAIKAWAADLDGTDRGLALSLAMAVQDIVRAQPFISVEPDGFGPGFMPAIETAMLNLGVKGL